MLRKKSIGRHVIGAGILLTLGSLAGATFPKTAASEPKVCGLEKCTGPHTCEFSFYQWYCDDAGPFCITRDCGSGEMQCPPRGICTK